MTLLIKNGHVVDPANQISEVLDILIDDDSIAKVAKGISDDDAEIIDATGLIVAPGFIDLHVHLRDPGLEYKEDIESGSKTAVAGGFTTIVAMPNTKPVCDNIDAVQYVLNRGAKVGLLNIHQVGALSTGLNGKQLTDFKALKKAGVIALSDDGASIQNENLMLEAMKSAAKFDLLVISHPEDFAISKDGVMNEGPIAKQLGFPGIPKEAEESIIERDINLAKDTGAKLHIAHISTKRGVELVRVAKNKGLKITCEVMPHHIALTENDVSNGDPNMKMNPPLRTEEDRQALINGIKDGTIDAIATDHAPHSPDEKGDFIKAPFGVIGMETALPICLKVANDNGISLEKIIELLTFRPAMIINRQVGTLTAGSGADVVLFNKDESFTIDPKSFRSKSRNCPFNGWNVKGRIKITIHSGKIVFSDN